MFSDETLFFMFYSSPRDALQEVAAQELYVLFIYVTSILISFKFELWFCCSSLASLLMCNFLIAGTGIGGITKTSVCGSPRKVVLRHLRRFKVELVSKANTPSGIQKTGSRSERI